MTTLGCRLNQHQEAQDTLYAGLAQVRVELIDRFGGWDGALKAIMNAQGRTPRGVHPAVLAVSGPDYAAELRKRGFSLTESWLE